MAREAKVGRFASDAGIEIFGCWRSALAKGQAVACETRSSQFVLKIGQGAAFVRRDAAAPDKVLGVGEGIGHSLAFTQTGRANLREFRPR